MNEQQFRAAVEAAVRECDEYLGKDVVGAWETMLDKIMFQVHEHAQEEYTRGLADGRLQEREVHFG